MRRQTCTKTELHIDDRVLDRILAAWGKWWGLATLLQIALRRRPFADLGNYLRLVKVRKGRPAALRLLCGLSKM